MPIQTEKELSDNARALWLKSLHAVELRNYGYAISLIQAILKEFPGFLEGRKRLRKVEIIATKGKKSFLSGLSTASLKGAGMVKKDPLAAMELAEKNLETDPNNSQINHLLKEAAKAAQFPEIAAFALETIIEANPTDFKTMHELGEYYLTMGDADKAVALYSKIAEANPADLIAVKRSKDAAATASMKSGGWNEAKSYRDLIQNKEEAISLEQKNRVVKSADMIDQQLGELTPEWEANQTNVDLTRRIARLWDDRFEIEPTVENLDGAYYYYHHGNELLGGADPAIVRKLSELQLRRLDVSVKGIEDWLAQVGEEHDEVEAYREELKNLKQQKAELLIADARKRVERNPTDLQLAYELGEQLVKAGMYTEAIKELQRARQNPNARLKAMNLLGQCYTEKGMLDLAVKQFQDAASEIIAMDVTKKEVLYKLGLVFERMGKKDESLNCMKQIYEVDYGYMDVAKRVEEIVQAADLRIVCLSAEAADICAELGAWESVVAVSAFALQEGRTRRPVIGGFSSVDAKRVASLRPDLVIAFSDVQAGIVAELVRTGCTVLATNQRTLREIEATIRLIGGAIGRAAEAEMLASQFAMDLVALQTEAGPRPRVYFEEWPEPLVSAIGWVGELIERCGGEDVFAARRGRAACARQVEPQEIIAANPDIVLASWCGKKVDLDSIRRRPGFESMAALRNGELHALESDVFLQPGPRLIEGARTLRRLFDGWRMRRPETLAS